MTQEEKAKAYDEALERAKGIHSFSSDIAEIKRMEQIFPELAESEDERIANAIKKHLDMEKSERNLTGYFGVSYQEAVAWLEKQGEQKPKWKQRDDIRFSQLYDFLVNKTPRLQVDCNEYAAWLNSLKQRMQ